MNRGTIYDLIDAERERQRAKFGSASIGGDAINNDKRIAIMAEELGEVAKAADALALRGGSYADELRAELVQVAACAVGWLERFGAPEHTVATPAHEVHALRAELVQLRAQVADQRRYIESRQAIDAEARDAAGAQPHETTAQAARRLRDELEGIVSGLGAWKRGAYTFDAETMLARVMERAELAMRHWSGQG